MFSHTYQAKVRVFLVVRAHCASVVREADNMIANCDWSDWYSVDTQRNNAKYNRLEREAKMLEAEVVRKAFELINIAYGEWKS